MEKTSLTYNSDMEYLLNPLINCKMPEQNISKKDIKFYRKRIINLVKNLLYKKENNDEILDNVLLNSFKDFTQLSIQYFKSVDANDLIQKDYEKINFKIDEEHLSDGEDYNETITKKHVKQVTMDNFVKKINKKNATPIIPFQKKVDIENPELKYKDCKKKDHSREKKEKSMNII